MAAKKTRDEFPKRIAVILPRSSDLMHDIWYGALDIFSRDRRIWISSIDASDAGMKVLKNWQADGILAYVTLDETVNLLRPLGIPIVNISGILDPCPFPTVTLDNFKTGEMAAEHLLAKKHTSFAFLGVPGHGYSQKRQAGFQAKVEAHGHTVHSRIGWLRAVGMGEPESRMADAEEILGWVNSLPEGTGLFCVDDFLAQALTELLALKREDPLRRLSIITGHHSRLPMFPGISGVRQNENRWGREAARLIIRMVLEKAAAPSLTLVPPIGVAEMESTAGVVTTDPEVRACARFIHQHVHEGINVQDVVLDSAVGRRALERRFAHVMGHSILEEIQRARMDRCKQLLRNTAQPLQDIALQAGFTDHKHLQRVFTQREGVNPGAYRNLSADR